MSSNRQISPQAFATAGTYLLPVAFVLLWWVAFQLGGPLRPRVMAAAAIAALAAAAGVLLLGLAWRRAGASRLTAFHVPVVANLIVLAACFAVLEVATRIVAKPHQLGARIGSVVLAPYDWEAAKATNRQLLERSRGASSLLVDSAELGWTVGTSRRSASGKYTSSAEGLRSAQPGERLLQSAATRRVAIFGDSFAFSEEVPFEQSLNVHLERQLGNGAQVVTFGVPGYGIDQAVLRFEREVQPWTPQVSILQFIADDINRIGHVYLFNKPDWMFPFVKPRFVLRDNALQQLSLPTPDQVYATRTVFDLPHLEADGEFEPAKWSDFPLSSSHLLRFVASRAMNSALHSTGDPASNEAIAVAAIERFVAKARAIGSVPVVAYFPDHRELDGPPSDAGRRVLAALAARGIAALDTSDCMKAGGGPKELVVGGGPAARSSAPPAPPDGSVGDIEHGAMVHYSNAGNERMARCLLPAVQRGLAARATPSPAN